MELRHLRYFVAIAEEQSFTRAAERLWVAQPGLSTQIRKLEQELGTRVFERHTRGVELTAAGELLLQRARDALAAAELAGATGGDIAAGLAGRLRLGIATAQSWRCAAETLERFMGANRAIELTVLEGGGGALWRDLRDGRLDALLAPARFASPDLQSLALGAEPWMVLAGASHRLAGSGALTAAALEGERIAIAGDGERRGEDRAIAELLDGLGVSAVLERAAPGPALHATVARGDALVLTTAPAALAPGVVARELESAPQLEFALLWRERVSQPALARLVTTAAELADGRPRRRASLRAVA
ncbi:MAG TPA: LysR family transcriptional regulator [Solirubrobacteraceae bacterium]|jgi:DNA-binding transcriptional LysR family regulator|nr:LysR family transcriptional regulator [Solirubrobacteraceae bacterium]